jgi:hypothetical protein
MMIGISEDTTLAAAGGIPFIIRAFSGDSSGRSAI